jgi:hypothetical protein
VISHDAIQDVTLQPQQRLAGNFFGDMRGVDPCGEWIGSMNVWLTPCCALGLRRKNADGALHRNTRERSKALERIRRLGYRIGEDLTLRRRACV